MIEEHPLSEYLDFGYSSFGQPEVGASTIRVPIREFSVAKGFPGVEQSVIYKQGALIFEGVKSSIRMVREYKTPKADSFKPEYTITHDDFVETDEEVYLFYLGGYSYDPFGWVEWDILAANVRIEEGGETIVPIDLR